MKLEVLVSTMNQNNYEIIDNMNINTDAIIINQCGKDGINIIKRDNFKVKFINSKEKGLSKSRNKAIHNSTSDICILADDDLVYQDNLVEIINTYFKANPDVDIITFQVEGINKKFKQYSDKEKKLNYISALKISSVEIAFKTNSIKKNNIKFREEFGSGSKYIMGEENIFLYDCLKSGLKIKYIPIKIADLYIGDSTWFKGYSKKYFISRGAGYGAMSKKFSILLIMQFAIRHYKKYSSETSLFKSIKYMFEGRKEYLNSIKER